ncbi:acetyltransferase [Amylibacter ulvae]|uniref:Acetyltransferase n=1 Tax=Paramylibacter ulvae TaxID=1651968 RepID=A0ABQ3CZ12_9RHOB|nr:N-acetyltransferase [Amylibacter ulvae]GHA48977.1 acetyltransferase [Amylibacter ulvae]
MIQISPATNADQDAIWAILEPVFRAGDTYAIDPDISRENALSYWMEGNHSAFVCHDGNTVLGTYYICPNQAGNGAHICNCGFATSNAAQGKGVARAMLDHALTTATTKQFRAMQFNFVVASNTRAIAIWQRNGFDVIGRIPDAFDHPQNGMVDALIMYRKLDE